ncbi:MAG: hypothetical protein ACXAD7_23550, partial [Candidatus Kariarchaeaceae archaeon]
MSTTFVSKIKSFFIPIIMVVVFTVLFYPEYRNLFKNLNETQLGIIVLTPCFLILLTWKLMKNAQYSIGHAFIDDSYTPYTLSLQDLAQGGLICGAIGTGKT